MNDQVGENVCSYILSVGKIFHCAVNKKYKRVVIYFNYFVKCRAVAAKPTPVKVCSRVA